MCLNLGLLTLMQKIFTVFNQVMMHCTPIAQQERGAYNQCWVIVGPPSVKLAQP